MGFQATTTLATLDGVAISSANPLPTTASAGVTVAVTGAASLTANTDTLYTFASQVRHFLIQNNTSTDLNVNFDAVASAGTYLIPAGQERAFDVPCTIVHLLSAATSNVNGVLGSNIVLMGWS